MGGLILAGMLFFGTHLGVSSTPLRGALIRATNDRAYLGIYSLLAVTTLGYLIYAYNTTPHTLLLWAPTNAGRWVALVLMPIALVFLLGGFMTRNPTAVGQEGAAKTLGEGRGLLRITRHPFQWAVVLWAVAHIVANGDAASLVFFGSLGLVSLLGGVLMDRKKAITLAGDWPAVVHATSNLPFLAILQGRNRFVISELLLPVVVGVAAYGILLWTHQWVSGVALL